MKRFIKNIFSKFFEPKTEIIGKDNILQYGNKPYFRKVRIKIYGNNNSIKIHDNTYLHNVKLQIGFENSPVDNCCITIGNKTSINGSSLLLGEDNSEIKIGKECMFSFDVEMSCSDTHAILDEQGNLINRGESIIVGDHVWVCKNATIMKNTKIPNGCIVAQGSIVTKKFEKENSVIAGNPAKLVKENIRWDRVRPNKLLREKNNE